MGIESHPLKILFEEHKLIQKMNSKLKDMAVFISSHHDVTDQKLEAAERFIREFIHDFHFAKEEKFLFPALSAKGVGEKYRILDILKNDHDQITQYFQEIDVAMQDKHQARSVNLLKISEVFHKYGGLISKHIANENETLFPIAVKFLNEANYSSMAKNFADFTLKTLGKDYLEKYEDLIEKLS